MHTTKFGVNLIKKAQKPTIKRIEKRIKEKNKLKTKNNFRKIWWNEK